MKKLFAGLTALTMMASASAMVASAAVSQTFTSPGTLPPTEGEGNVIEPNEIYSVTVPLGSALDFGLDLLDFNSPEYGTVRLLEGPAIITNESSVAIGLEIAAVLTNLPTNEVDVVATTTKAATNTGTDNNIMLGLVPQNSFDGYIVPDGAAETLKVALEKANYNLVNGEPTTLIAGSGSTLPLNFGGYGNINADWTSFKGDTPDSKFSVEFTYSFQKANSADLAALASTDFDGYAISDATGISATYDALTAIISVSTTNGSITIKPKYFDISAGTATYSNVVGSALSGTTTITDNGDGTYTTALITTAQRSWTSLTIAPPNSLYTITISRSSASLTDPKDFTVVINK